MGLMRPRAIFGKRGCGAVLLICMILAWLMGPAIVKWQVRKSLADRNLGAADSWLSRLEWLAPNDAEAWFLRARLARKRGDWSHVRESLLKARQLGVSVDRLEREQWLTLAQSGQMRLAEPHLSKLLTDPQDDGAEICEAYVNGYFLNYRMTEALRLLDAWIADFPKDTEPRIIRGKIRIDQQFLKEAEADFRSAWTLDPQSTSAGLQLADVLILERKIEEALKVYQQLKQQSAAHVNAQIGEAKALRLLNRPAAAGEIARRILVQQPNNREARLELALAEMDLEHLSEAVAILKQALQQNPRSLMVRQALAKCLRATGNSEEAVEHAKYVEEAQAALQKADALAMKVVEHPDDIRARYEIGMAFLKYAVPERGIQWLKSVLNYDPNHEAAKRAIEAYHASSPVPGDTETQAEPQH